MLSKKRRAINKYTPQKSTMKIKISQKIAFWRFFFIAILISSNSLAWTGYDFDDKNQIEIGSGNLVREGFLIQFYDSKSDNYHSAKVLFLDDVSGGSRLQVKDLDLNKERTFIMEN